MRAPDASLLDTHEVPDRILVGDGGRLDVLELALVLEISVREHDVAGAMRLTSMHLNSISLSRADAPPSRFPKRER